MVGTEWAAYRAVHGRAWDFGYVFTEVIPTLQHARPNDGTYLFAQTEPHFIGAGKQDSEVLLVPVLVMVQSPTAPPSTVAITSIQMAKQELVPMQQMHMGWRPWVSDEQHAAVMAEAELAPALQNVAYLHCELHWDQVAAMPEEQLARWSYVMPYINAAGPQDGVDQGVLLEVELQHPALEKPLALSYHSELYDSPQSFAEEMVDEESLPAECVKAITDMLEEKLCEVFSQVPKDEDEMVDMEKINVVKFYPHNPELNLEQYKLPFINRYYGQAAQVF